MEKGPRIFTHTEAQAIAALRSMRAFERLRGQFQELVIHIGTPKRWAPGELEAYNASAGKLLLRDHTFGRSGTERICHDRNGLLNIRAIVRRISFLFGAQCVVCRQVYDKYNALPISDNWRTRWPFAEEVAPNAIEPLCPYCRKSFQDWYTRYMHGSPNEQELDLCATGWLARQTSRVAGLVRRAA